MKYRPNRISITTKTGDDGYTDFNNKRLRKDDDILECLGTIDELNSYIGICPDWTNPNDSPLIMNPVPAKTDIQTELIQICSCIYKNTVPKNIYDITTMIERYIEHSSYEFSDFVIPDNVYHVARTICRRAERCAARLFALQKVNDVQINICQPILIFLNRLSDFLFILAVNYKMR